MPASGLEAIPPFAGVCSSEEARRPGFSVVEASRRLRRFAFVKQQLALLAAKHLNPTPEWEVKSALALHAWYDAEHASGLRARILELREPEARLDEVADPRLAEALEEAQASGCGDTLELLTAIYGVLRPALLLAMQRYQRETNPLADQPTCRLLKRILVEEREAIAWGEQALRVLQKSSKASELSEHWAAHLRAYLAAASGIEGVAEPQCASLPPRRAEQPFVPEVLPRRDPRFRGLFDTSTPADTIYLDDRRPIEERNLALLFKRLREMDVPEVIAGILAQTPEKPWPYYAEMLRQMWDEARHSLIGQAAFEAHGVEWTRLPINVSFSWKLAKFCTPLERHVLLYAIEQSLMPARRGKRYEWELARASGDALSTMFHDYDWADEVLHASIGRNLLRPEFEGGLEELRRTADRLWEKVAQGLEREPMPQDSPPPDWWQRFAESVLGRPVPPVSETDVKDWRPLSA